MVLACLLIALSQQASALQDHEAQFRLDAGRLEVKVVLGDKAGWFILDSAGPTFITDKSLAAGVVSRKKPDVETADGTLRVAEVDKVRVGGAMFSKVDFMVANAPLLHNFQAGTSLPFDGVLGYDFLCQTSIGIDFDRFQIWFWGPRQGAEAESSFFAKSDSLQTIPLHAVKDSWSTVEVKLDCGSVEAILDLGSYLSSMPTYRRESLAGHSFEEGLATIAEPDKVVHGNTYVLDRMWLGQSKIVLPITTVVTTDNDDIVGWLTLAAFHRVLLDFDGGRIVAPKGSKLNGLHWVLDDTEISSLNGKSRDWMALKDWFRLHAKDDAPNEPALKSRMVEALAEWAGVPRIGKRIAKGFSQSDFRPKALAGPEIPLNLRTPPTPSIFTDGAGYYVMKGSEVSFKMHDNPMYFHADKVPTIVAIGGLPEAILKPALNQKGYLSFDPSKPDLPIVKPPSPPAYRLKDSKTWLSLPTTYDEPIYLPADAELRLTNGWKKVGPTPGTGLIKLFPPGLRSPTK